MNGVLVLGTVSAVSSFEKAGLVIMGLIMIISVFCVGFRILYNEEGNIGQGLLIIFMGVLLLFMFLSSPKLANNDSNYLVTVDSSVSFQEFMEHYDVISREKNNMYIVQKRG